ncbi:MAG: outer membrane beta-barrel protein [Taibaiella sp.]|jgi:hypothetical protein
MEPLHQSRVAKPVIILAMLLFLSPVNSVKAQDATDMFGISAGGGYTFSHSDFQWTKTIPSPTVGAGIHYFSLDFLAVNLDFQKGLLKGGASLDDADATETGFENNYLAFCLSFRFFPVALASEEAKKESIVRILSTLYFGTGVGNLTNNVKANGIASTSYGSMADYKGSNIFVPLELGVNFPVAKIRNAKLLVNINLRTNLCFSDKIDGYEPTVEANQHNDAYSALTGGLVYKFGL